MSPTQPQCTHAPTGATRLTSDEAARLLGSGEAGAFALEVLEKVAYYTDRGERHRWDGAAATLGHYSLIDRLTRVRWKLEDRKTRLRTKSAIDKAKALERSYAAMLDAYDRGDATVKRNLGDRARRAVRRLEAAGLVDVERVRGGRRDYLIVKLAPGVAIEKPTRTKEDAMADSAYFITTETRRDGTTRERLVAEDPDTGAEVDAPDTYEHRERWCRLYTFPAPSVAKLRGAQDQLSAKRSKASAAGRAAKCVSGSDKMRVGVSAKCVSGTQQNACETTTNHSGNHEGMPLAARGAASSSPCPREGSPGEVAPVPDQKLAGLWFAVTDVELDELADEGLLEFAWNRRPADGPGYQLLEVPADEVGEVERGLALLRRPGHGEEQCAAIG